MKINGIVLAAGYGSRLAPLTLQVPKPVLPLCGESMMLRILRRLREAGVEQIAVNCHHLKEKVERCIQNSEFAPFVKLYYEEEILGTAGPLVNAKELLTDCDYFVLHNGDVTCDFDLKRMIREHIQSGASLTMAVVDGPENRVHVENEYVVDILDRLDVPYSPVAEKLTYACVSVFSKEFFDCLPDEVKPVSFLDAWLRALRTGHKIHVFRPDPGYFWSDIGSFSQYFEAHKRIMLDGCAPSFNAGKPLIVGKDCVIAPDAVFSGFNALGNHCEVPAGTHLHNCILLDGAKARSGYSAWEVFGRTFSCHRDQKQLNALKIFEKDSKDLRFISLPEQGSDRKFYRVQNVFNENRILMVSSSSDKDFDRFLSLGSIFHKYKMRTPEIFAFNREEYTVLMEDLGDGTLYNLCHGRSSEVIRPLYRETIAALADFQRQGSEAIGTEDLSFRIFTRRLLRWESDYFFRNFLAGICGMAFTEKEQAELFAEFEAIASAAEKLPYVPIHRDFQSQNILKKDDRIRFVDFQGARLGPYTYDLASLIKDPYMALPEDLRNDLYGYAFQVMRESGYQVSEETFVRDCAIGALQRNMQALGAYGFLSLKKGKMKYLDSAAPCLVLLQDGLRRITACKDAAVHPVFLSELCNRAEEILPSRIRMLKGNQI